MAIAKLLSSLYKASEYIIEITGVMLVVLLSVYGISHTPLILKTPNGEFELSALTSGYFPIIFIGAFMIYTVGMTVNMIKGIKRGVARFEESRSIPQEDANKVRRNIALDVLKWLIR